MNQPNHVNRRDIRGPRSRPPILCSHVQYRETVFVDRPKLRSKRSWTNLRERISIDFFRSLPADFIQLFFCAINERREYPFWNGAHLLHHIGNLLGIGDNHLIGFFLCQDRRILPTFPLWCAYKVAPDDRRRRTPVQPSIFCGNPRLWGLESVRRRWQPQAC